MQMKSTLVNIVILVCFLMQGCSGCSEQQDQSKENIESISSGLENSLEEMKQAENEVTEEDIQKQEEKIEEFETELKKSPTIQKSDQEKSELILNLVSDYLESGKKSISDSILVLFQYPDIVSLYDSSPEFQEKMTPYFTAKQKNGH